MFNFLKKHSSEPALTEHIFFSNITKMLSYDIENLPITNTLKKRVVICFLSILFDKIYKLTLSLCEDLNASDLSNISSIYIKIIRDAEDEALKSGVPEIFIERFRSWDSNHINTIINSMTQIANSKFHKGNYEKMKAILDVMNAIMQLQLLDIERTIDSLNGELEKAIRGTLFDS